MLLELTNEVAATMYNAMRQYEIELLKKLSTTKSVIQQLESQGIHNLPGIDAEFKKTNNIITNTTTNHKPRAIGNKLIIKGLEDRIIVFLRQNGFTMRGLMMIAEHIKANDIDLIKVSVYKVRDSIGNVIKRNPKIFEVIGKGRSTVYKLKENVNV